MKFDCVVIIDCWSVFQVIKGFPQWSSTRIAREVEQLETFYKNFKSVLEHNHEFDSVLYAVYRNPDNSILYKYEDTPDFENIPSDKRWMYRSNPLKSQNLGNSKVNSLTVDEALPIHVESLTKNTNKNILVCGRSWGACIHHREVGIETLMHHGYNVFVDRQLVHSEQEHVTRQEPFGISHRELLDDDVVWTTHRTPGERKHRLQHNLYRAVAIHQDRVFNNPNPTIDYEDDPSLYTRKLYENINS